jgi:hypothetical protein
MLTDCTLSFKPPPHPTPGKVTPQKLTSLVTTYEQPLQFGPDQTVTLARPPVKMA